MVFRADDVFGTTEQMSFAAVFEYERALAGPSLFPQVFMILHSSSVAIALHVLGEAPVESERGGRNLSKVATCVDTSHFAIRSIGTCILALTTCTHQTRRRTGLQTETQMLDGAAVDTDSDGWHFLLFTPSNCFLIVVITVNTNSFQNDQPCMSRIGTG